LTVSHASAESDWSLAELCAISLMVFTLSVLLHSPFLVPNIYSDINSVWARPEIHSSNLPYVGYAFDYPALVAWLLYLSTRSDYTAYITIQAAALGLSVLVVVVALRKLSVPTFAVLLYVVAAPTMLVYGFYNWDLMMVALALLAVLAFKQKRIVTTGFLLGLSAATKVYSLVFAPILLSEIRTWRERTFLALSCGVGWLLPNLPFMLINWNGWFGTWVFYGNWGFEDTWLLLLSPGDHYNFFVKAFGFFLLAIVLLRVTISPEPNTALNKRLLMVALAWLLFSYISTPQMVLFLLPLFALTRTRYSIFYASEISNALIILTWFTTSNPITPEATPALLNLLRQGVWSLLLFAYLVPNWKNFLRWLKAPLTPL